MKILNLAFLLIAFLFFGCNLEPLPLEIPKDSFDLRIDPPSGYTLSSLIDGVQLKNGDFVVIGRTVKNAAGDILVARFDKEGKQIINLKVFNSGGDEVPSSIAMDIDENIYVTGNSSTNGLLFKISTKSGGIDSVWTKTQVYGTLPNNSWFARILIENSQIYLVEALKSGGSTDNYGIRRLDLEGVASPLCTTGKVNSFVVLDAIVLNGKIYACGHTSSSVQTSWLTSSHCTAPILKNYVLPTATSFHAARSLIANSSYVFMLSNDQPPGTIYKPILYRCDPSTLSQTGNITTIDPSVEVSNLQSFQGWAMCLGNTGTNILLTINYSVNGDNKVYTQLRNVETGALNKVWAKSHNINSTQVINAQDGGNLIIGNAEGSIGKVIKTNSIGECSSCK
jgi:Beta-propeller repeat